jgi:ubiquinone/menaquinone biosynthesis C-methylase UbiE
MIEGHSGIRDAYRDEQVARDYVDRRFREPLGAMLHDLQLARLRQVLRSMQPAEILEVAPGPARLTLGLAADLQRRGTVVDASRQMLAEGRARLGAARSSWRFVQGDAFHLPFRGPFDLIYTFRLIRHFADADRARLYAQIARILRPGGVLVFDAVNETVARSLRNNAGNACHHYDALLTPGRIRSELDAAGLDLLRLDDIQRHYPLMYRLQVLVAPRSRRLARAAMDLVGSLPGGEPLEWVVTATRRP